MAKSTGQVRLLSTSATAGSAVLTAGRYTDATLVAALTNAESCIVSLGPVGDSGERKRGVEIGFFGTGADNSTGSYKVWRVKRGRTAGSNQPNDMELQLLGSGGFTLSTATGATSASTVTSSERVADTITWTQATSTSGPGDLIQTNYDSPSPEAYSPANNTPAVLFIPDCGNGDILIEMWLGTATAVNAVVEAGT